jgi:serine/threonine protein kinase
MKSGGGIRDLAGKTIGGKYQLTRVLGGGGMGVVYEARNTRFGKRVALKLVDREADESGELIERLVREAKAAARIESDGLVQVLDVCDDEQLGTFLVMEYLLGEGLDARVGRGPLDVSTSMWIAHRVARVLARAHAAGIIHRDLKPANIFLVTREDGTMNVKILDFGLAKTSGPGTLRLTRQGAVLGTPQYMSPEQARGVDDLDARTDLWAVGCMLYECLCGRPAYPELNSYQETLLHMVTERPPPLTSIAPWVSPAVVSVVDKLIVHDRDQRISDCITLIRHLEHAMQG